MSRFEFYFRSILVSDEFTETTKFLERREWERELSNATIRITVQSIFRVFSDRTMRLQHAVNTTDARSGGPQ
jgi:hypothetical protein